ncbi:MAG: helix-turn-helix domain-containing protein [Solirubrobacterales bacterium]
MNYIGKYGKNFVAISDNIEADCHKHWLFQMFISCEKDLNIEVNGQIISSGAIIVNIDTPHIFCTEGEPHFTMLFDPTTEHGRKIKELLKGQPFYIFQQEETDLMQRTFINVLKQISHDTINSFVQSIFFQLPYSNMQSFDNRVMQVLNLLDDCTHEDELHKIKHFSKTIGLSESRLAHLFKKEIGIPLKSYIVLHKLQRAYQLILNGENITTAALDAGFDSPSHLAYTNKIITGMTATNIIRDSEFLKVF